MGESLGLISLIALLVAIVIGFVWKANVGIVSIALALIIGRIYGIAEKTIIAGFSSSLFITMVGVTYLLGILMQNKTLDNIANLFVSSVKRHVWLIPIVFYCLGFILSAIGPGSIPILAIIPVLAVPIALSAGYNPIMLAIMGECGCFGGRMTPITPEGVVVMNLMGKQGINTNLFPIWASLFVASLVLAAVVYIVYKGWKVKYSEANLPDEKIRFNKNQVISLAGLLVMIVCTLAFKVNVGLISFLVGTVILLFGVGNEGASIKSIPWNVLLMVVGVGMLMNIVVQSDGITLLSNALSSIMTPFTGTAIMGVTGGIMSFFSSGLGVVFPTLIPTVGGIASHFNGAVSPVELAAAVVIGGTITGVSPISTTGGLIMAAISSQPDAEKKYDINKIFLKLWGWAFVALAVTFILAITGVFHLICMG
ncbi:citrate transporter [Caproiciproducens sp. NJN-50]|uniref:SLC13 family permease n=1 Tax=Acutalibacteraceae TaxID=3082771 RepID=UPI000FFE20D9|nr:MULTISPECIES: SLC13 family permease [Acutalibacteraceae]QAT49248.1 citrate transporter [Caproiciproducens sp. NJN-50]